MMHDLPPLTDRDHLRDHQTRRLRDLLVALDGTNPFWTGRLREAGVRAADITSLDVLRRLPPVAKGDLVADQDAHPPYGTNLTAPVGRYSRLHQTSGTTGRPLRWLDTPASWMWVLDCWEQLWRIAGLTSADRLFFPFSFGPFLGFWAGFEGANRLGNLCLPGGGMSSAARLRFLLDNSVTIVCCTPTYALRLGEAAAEEGFDLPNSPVRMILTAGEPGGNVPATRARIERAWGARVVDHWGMTELGPLAMESPAEPGGLLVLESECIAEVVEPGTWEPVPPGAEGELLVTNLGRVDSPLIRYRTGDRVRAVPGETPQPVRLRHAQGEAEWRSVPLLKLDGGILGRADDMLTIRGNNLYPAALEEVIRSFPEVVEFRIEVREDRAMQEVRIDLECAPEADGVALATRVAETIKDRWNFQARVVPLPPESLPRFELKARRFFRRREGETGNPPHG
jgi:phenylacetate-CoA ligase